MTIASIVGELDAEIARLQQVRKLLSKEQNGHLDDRADAVQESLNKMRIPKNQPSSSAAAEPALGFGLDGFLTCVPASSPNCPCGGGDQYHSVDESGRTSADDYVVKFSSCLHDVFYL